MAVPGPLGEGRARPAQTWKGTTRAAVPAGERHGDLDVDRGKGSCEGKGCTPKKGPVRVDLGPACFPPPMPISPSPGSQSGSPPWGMTGRFHGDASHSRSPPPPVNCLRPLVSVGGEPTQGPQHPIILMPPTPERGRAGARMAVVGLGVGAAGRCGTPALRCPPESRDQHDSSLSRFLSLSSHSVSLHCLQSPPPDTPSDAGCWEKEVSQSCQVAVVGSRRPAPLLVSWSVCSDGH